MHYYGYYSNRSPGAPKERYMKWLRENSDARIERLKKRLVAGDPDLEPDELQLAVEAAQRKRKELFDAQPASRNSAKIIAALPQSCRGL